MVTRRAFTKHGCRRPPIGGRNKWFRTPKFDSVETQPIISYALMRKYCFSPITCGFYTLAFHLPSVYLQVTEIIVPQWRISRILRTHVCVLEFLLFFMFKRKDGRICRIFRKLIHHSFSHCSFYSTLITGDNFRSSSPRLPPSRDSYKWTRWVGWIKMLRCASQVVELIPLLIRSPYLPSPRSRTGA